MNTKLKTRDLTLMALLVALLSASAYVSITIPVGEAALTLQTLMINLIALLLTPYQSFLTVLVYILLGLVGLPVFSGGTGGAGKLFGPTGGYIFAFLVAAPVMSICKDVVAAWIQKICASRSLAATIGYAIVTIALGMTIIYAIGTVYMMVQLNMNLKAALVAAVIPYIPLDLFKCVAASVLAVQLRHILDRIR